MVKYYYTVLQNMFSRPNRKKDQIIFLRWFCATYLMKYILKSTAKLK